MTALRAQTATSSAPVAPADYRAKLTTAKDAMAEVADGSTIAMGLSPCQPPALLARAGRPRAWPGTSPASRSTTRSRAGICGTRSSASSTSGASSPTACSSAPPSVSWRPAPGPRAAARSSISCPTSSSSSIARSRSTQHRRHLHDDRRADGRRGLFQLRHQQRLLLRACRRRATRVVVEVNRHMPAVRGPARIHVSEVAAIVEHDTPLEEFPVAPAKDLDPLIARNVVELIPDGATLQMGIGSLPGVVCSVLERHNDLGIHTELLTPPMARLMRERHRQQPPEETGHRQDGLHLRPRRPLALRLHERSSGDRRSPGLVRRTTRP